MDGSVLQNLISKGWGTAARRTGVPYIVYRPNGSANPLSSRNRVIRLYATLVPSGGTATGINGYGSILWRGVFDSSYTLPGDYLIGPDASFFIASQWTGQPILCVQTHNIVTIYRSQTAVSGSYSGFVVSAAQEVVLGWPTLLVASTARIAGTLPEAHFGNWIAFLPTLPTSLQVADVVSDDLGRQFIVAAAQSSGLGWRLILRQVDG
jgi:hypothetical protein